MSLKKHNFILRTMKTKEICSFETANKSKNFIDQNGVFQVRVSGETLDVMLFNDFKKSESITQYDFVKSENNGKVKRFFIAGRTRNSSVVVINDKLTPSEELQSITTEMLSDENGYFEVLLNGKFRKAIFFDQYAKHQRLTKQAVRKRCSSRKAMFEKYFIKTATSKVPLCLAVMKGGVKSK